MGRYDLGMACLNGHSVNSSADTSPERNSEFCPRCGEPTTTKCSECGAAIRGYYRVPGVMSLSTWDPSSHCHNCGHPYSWTTRRAEALEETIEELDGLNDDERAKLRQSIPDILVHSPKSETAVLRFKKAVAKVGSAGAKVMMDVLMQVAADAVKSSLGF